MPVEAVSTRPPKGFRERRVASLFTEVLGVPVFGADDDFFVLGGDDRFAARLLDVIAEDAGVRLSPRAVRECPTVSALAGRIAGVRPTRRARVVGYGTELAGRPLFCTMAAFQARALGRAFNTSAGRPFYAVQPAGLEGRARPDRSVTSRARRAVDDIRAVQPHGPYLVAGYSYHGWVAFEAARRLQEAGETVELLAVIDVWAPVFGRVEVAKLLHETRRQAVAEWLPETGGFDARRRAHLARATASELVTGFGWRARGWSAGVIPRPATLQGKLFHQLSDTTFRSYRPKPTDLDLVVLRAGDFGGWDWAQRRLEPDLSWHQVTTGHIEVVPIAGDHVTILERDSAGLAAALARAVDARTHSRPSTAAENRRAGAA